MLGGGGREARENSNVKIIVIANGGIVAVGMIGTDHHNDINTISGNNSNDNSYNTSNSNHCVCHVICHKSFVSRQVLEMQIANRATPRGRTDPYFARGNR